MSEADSQEIIDNQENFRNSIMRKAEMEISIFQLCVTAIIKHNGMEIPSVSTNPIGYKSMNDLALAIYNNIRKDIEVEEEQEG